MKQLGHAGSLVELLDDPSADSAQLKDLLVAQLSHSDGIRGFMVTYLTAETSPADQPAVPLLLKEAMSEVVDDKELIPLACMNVIMPTAMITMHTDATLSKQSQTTAERGTKLLASFQEHPLVQDNVKAILAVATDNDDDDCDDKLVKYWTDFFEKWGYQAPQKKDIAKTVRGLLL